MLLLFTLARTKSPFSHNSNHHPLVSISTQPFKSSPRTCTNFKFNRATSIPLKSLIAGHWHFCDLSPFFPPPHFFLPPCIKILMINGRGVPLLVLTFHLWLISPRVKLQKKKRRKKERKKKKLLFCVLNKTGGNV